MSKKRIFSCIFPAYLAIILLSIGSIVWIFSRMMYNSYVDMLRGKLSASAYSMSHSIAGMTGEGRMEELTKHIREIAEKNKMRITLIAADGVVIAESTRDPLYMENHINRPEVISAIQGKPAFETRHSGTVIKETMYFAIPLEKKMPVQHVLRLAVTIESVDRALSPFIAHVVLSSVFVAAVALGMAFFIAKKLSLPIERLKNSAADLAKGDFSSMPPHSTIAEIDDLAEAMISMSGSLQDTIIKLREQRNELKLILGNMREGVIAVDMDDNVITINAAAKQILNTGIPLAPAADRNSKIQNSINSMAASVQMASNGKDPFSFSQLVRIEEIHEFVGDILRENMFLQRRIELVGMQNKVIDVHGAVLRNQHGNAIGVLLVINDITQITQLESMRKNFAANVSHELKTPLTAIKGAVETLLEGAVASPEDAEKFLRIIEKHSDRLNALINDTMSLSKIEQLAEEHSIKKDRIRLAEVIKTSTDICREKAEKRKVSFNIDCHDSIELNANTQMVEQALVNLIDNAVKFSPEKGVVTVFAEHDGKLVTIKVTDNGCGISEEHLPRIFERFYRVDKGRSRQDGGTGLGLAIVKHIAQSHQGSVSVESVPNIRTTFNLRLPI
ncbi:MAG: HAMP domain-containing protein [Victivallales bacterium]|nr:HAMP domain-containing protein [Victivallales bacterium]